MTQEKIIRLIYFCTLLACLISCDTKQSKEYSSSDDKAQLLALEYKWLKAEFALDTVYLSSIIDSSFLDISATEIHNKTEALSGMYKNISQRIKDSIFIDSFKIENPIVNVFQHNAVVTFIVHTFRSEKGLKSERKTRFYDVWIKQNNDWKAIASQGTPIE